MDVKLWNFVLDNLEAAGVIGGYVSISIIGVYLITYVSRGKFSENNQIGPSWSHPIMGALLGIIPGCGATIVVSAMYKNQKISFGGLLATFIATLGEGSFVLLGASDEASVAANFKVFLIVNLVGASVAIVFGYLVDMIGINIQSPEIPEKIVEKSHHSSNRTTLAQVMIEYIGFYLMLTFSAFLLPGSILALWGGSTGYDDLSVWVASLFTLFSMSYYLVYRFKYKGHDCSHDNTVKETLLHAVLDISTVIVYVFIGLLSANYIIDILVGPETFDVWMTSSAFVVVVIAAIIGATPGCGGMISVAVAFITIPNFPIAALIAASIATSGDGIFPLVVSNKKAALIVTALGFIIALVVGYTILILGIEI
ncbi:putative manganese transporter [Carnobacterium sp. TMP28]|uniref:putative manganese transporter n=1 Tax=Carnobacterium sp. TMP28 TaxID=3397060 RepID=UPI0039E11838